MYYLCTRKRQGALVQLVRIHACHAWGHGFESRTHRTVDLQKLEKGALLSWFRASALQAEGRRFESVSAHEIFEIPNFILFIYQY